MKVIRRILYWIAVLALVLVTYWFGFIRKSAERPEEQREVPVEVELVMQAP